MKRIIQVILLSFLAQNSVRSQQFMAGFTMGIGTYSMSDLKEVNHLWLSLPDAKLSSDFPPGLYYQPSVMLKFRSFALGLDYTWQSAGSGMSSKGTTKEYRMNLNVHSNNAGIYAEMYVWSGKKNRLSLYARPGIAFSHLDMVRHFEIQDTVRDDFTLEYNAINFFIEPGVNYFYSLTPAISLGLNMGYYLDINYQAFHVPHAYSTVPAAGQIEPPGPVWRGFRFGLSVRYNFKVHATIPSCVTSILNTA